MKYIIAYDGGGTKTVIAVFDKLGNVLFTKRGPGSNVFSTGDQVFSQVISSLYEDAKVAVPFSEMEIIHIVLGLSGADLEEDYHRLNRLVKALFPSIPFTVLNDAWIIMRSGLKEPYGAVAICGTGMNSAAMNHQGNRAILRSLNYTLGTYGGGLDIARSGLHYAFRSEELTYQKTLLEVEIPRFFEVETMNEVLPLFYPEMKVDKKKLGEITGIVMTCADRGDKVSIEILENVAYHIGLETAGVIKQLKMENEEVPVVVGGKVFDVAREIFMNHFTKTLTAEVPQATVKKTTFPPVVGAYFYGLDLIIIKQTEKIESNIMKSGVMNV